MTTPADRIYYIDSYVHSFTATVTAAEAGHTRLFLNKTAFYPTSGGQPHDLGTLNGIAVQHVIDEGEQIAHVLAQPLEAQTVTGIIDWPRRYDHMQQHTGQHLLSAVFQDLWNVATVGFHMGSEISTIDLAIKELTECQAAEAEERANEAARSSVAIGITFEEAGEAQGLRKQSERSGTLRIVTIPGFDRSACGGTHVRQLSEVLPLQIRRLEKVRGNVRVEFAAGVRAVRLARRDFGRLTELARLAATTPDSLLAHFSGLRQRLTEVEKEHRRMTAQLAERAGQNLFNATEPGSDGVRRVFERVERIDEAQRVMAQAFVKQPQAIIFLLSPDGALLACSPDTGLNAGVILKQCVAAHGGSGGGSGVLAQGKLTGPDGERALLSAAGFSIDNR